MAGEAGLLAPRTPPRGEGRPGKSGERGRGGRYPFPPPPRLEGLQVEQEALGPPTCPGVGAATLLLRTRLMSTRPSVGRRW